MDELTLEGKKYLSSKRAAKITGYAKDYVGQMCREGRVNARLVGRSWYVLEDSIREHRFGKEKNTSDNAEVLITDAPDDSSLEEQEEPKIRYTAEKTVPIQTVVPKRSFLASEIQYIQKEEQTIRHETQGVSSMQDTWRQWFSATPQKEEKHTARVSISVKEEIPHTGKANDFNGNSENSDKSIPNERVDKTSDEHSNDVIMHNGEWQEVINHEPLSEDKISQLLQSAHSRSENWNTTIQKQQDTYSINIEVNHSVSLNKRIINMTLIMIAIVIGSFSVINLLSTNQSYGNTGTVWSSINYIGGVRAFVKK